MVWLMRLLGIASTSIFLCGIHSYGLGVGVLRLLGFGLGPFLGGLQGSGVVQLHCRPAAVPLGPWLEGSARSWQVSRQGWSGLACLVPGEGGARVATPLVVRRRPALAGRLRPWFFRMGHPLGGGGRLSSYIRLRRHTIVVVDLLHRCRRYPLL